MPRCRRSSAEGPALDHAERERIRALRALASSRGPTDPLQMAAGRLPNKAVTPHRASASNHSCGDRAVLVTDGLQVWQESEGCIICRAASAVAARIICTAEPEAAAAVLSSLADRVTDDATAGDSELLLLLSSVPPGRHRCMTLALDAARELMTSLTGG